jgi:AbrB family looped-hinge helix DNA binding protein
MRQSISQRAQRGTEMSLVKVIRNGQITLPADLREKLDIEEGDYLEAGLEGRTIVLRPQVLLNREDAVKALHQIMSDVQEQTKGVSPEVIEREVAEAIREVRKQKRHAKSRS